MNTISKGKGQRASVIPLLGFFLSVGVLAAHAAAQEAAQDPNALAAQKAQSEGRDAERIYFAALKP